MFDLLDKARVFGIPPGADFPADLLAGLRTHLSGHPPEAMAKVQLIVNTQRMARRLRQLIDQGPPGFAPRIDLLTAVGRDLKQADIPPAVSALRRRFELIQLVSRLIEQQPDLAPRTSLYDLADSLAALMDEMSGEGVSPDTIEALDVSDQSGHWERAQAFFGIARQFLQNVDQQPDSETRQRLVVEALMAQWQAAPPQHPVILAGSTGSRGTTMLLMQAVAKLPQGALVLPGFDFDTPAPVWQALGDALVAEDHPQYRFHKVLKTLDLTADQVQPWTDTPAPCPPRNKLISLALRPAPVTDQWLSEGPDLGDLTPATNSVTLVEAQSQRDEALAIAMRLRAAANAGQTAALITPDRMLTRQVTAALDRWDILPDDSAGTPLQLTPPGRFLRHVAALFTQPLTSEALLTLLKHPLTHSGNARNTHLRHTRDLELYLRKKGLSYPSAEKLRHWSGTTKDANTWTDWVITQFCVPIETRQPRALADWLSAHLARAETLARGAETAEGSGGLWEEKAGREAAKIVSDLAENAEFAGELMGHDYVDVFESVLRRGEVRDRDAPHPDILIWGTLEARVQGADVMILGGLNEGSWPEAPSPDPWLNRKLRHEAGLLLPERRIGLSAHDFQQAVGAKEVWLTRAIRSDDSETVPARWINRLVNLLSGLPEQGGPEALSAMRARGADWLAQVRALEYAPRCDSAPRPAPRPPVAARPTQLSVTEIKKLIRDPYAIYARHCLRLRPMEPLMRTPDALLRGIVVHEVLETFVKDVSADRSLLTHDHLMSLARNTLAHDVPWPATRALLEARIEKFAGHFLQGEARRQAEGKTIAFERDAKAMIPALGFTLTAKADRIDRNGQGDLVLYDYKTGNPPTEKEQRYFDKQLLLEAAMAENGAFRDIDPAEVVSAIYIGLGSTPKEVAAPLNDLPPAQVWQEFETLISRYLEADQGYTARRALRQDSDHSDYDQLSRFGEWDVTDAPLPEDLT
ncbi:double-strand break repair protein AddB [Cognatishimia sp. SS12]|uniref:double-strand break repair protein AddB n=1 Tax=Cognatishimia sp. SS12 TaxID=2979465 RepID=UPI00232D44F0|nr:double-strand break repair protein AddB [Cognatishimia sp. SS12]MDC0737758.1 double-strand break repair protein AddB [Cognatishimia sp. SS12]